MLKNFLIIICIFNLLNCAEEQPLITKLPYVIHRDAGTCNYMQDRSCAVIQEDHAFFGVFDGHGTVSNGHLIAELLSKNLYHNVFEHGISKGFELMDSQIDSQLEENIINREGSTASIVLIRNNKIFIGHVGDSKIILVRNNQAIELTHDHNITLLNDNDAEYVRIKDLAKSLNKNLDEIFKLIHKQWYISVKPFGSLAMTRSFGNKFHFPYVISTPEINSLDLTIDDEFLILATDGLWDVISYQDAVDILQSQNNWVTSAHALCTFAKAKWRKFPRMDNIEIVVVNLKELFKWQAKQQKQDRCIC